MKAGLKRILTAGLTEAMRRLRFLAAVMFSLGAASCGEGGSSEGVSESEIVVGTHVDLTGPISGWGVAVRNGIEMAFAEANEAGGVHGRMLRLVAEDNGYDTRRAISAVQKLLGRDHVFAILAPVGTPTVEATIERVIEAGTLHLFPLTAAPSAYEPFNRLKFAALAPYGPMLRAGVNEILKTQGFTRICGIFQSDDFGAALRDGASAGLKANGLEFVATETLARADADARAQVALLKDSQCELVILGTIAEATLTVLAAAHELEWSPVFLGSQAIYQENLATEPKGITENLYAMGQVAMPYPDVANGAMRSWIGRYEERFGARAGVEALVGYDLANLFIAALKAAGPDLTRERFAAALEELPPWTSGALGLAPLDYSASDHLGVRGGFLAQVKDGRWVTLAPVAIGE